MESLVFVALSPLATVLMVVVSLVAWRRRGAPGGSALVAFTASGIGWLVLDTLALLAPTTDATVRLVQATALFGPLLGVSWLAFVLSYTEHFSRPWRWIVGALVAWSVVYGVLAVTNDSHRLVWSAWEVVSEGALSRVDYTLGPLGWAQTASAWAGVTFSLGVLLRAYAGSGARARDLSRWIVAGALAPMALNVAYLLGTGPLEKDFTPIAMAVSAAAFAIGLARYQFLDLRPIARAALVDDLQEGMVVLDSRGIVADINPALQQTLREVVVGRPLSETAPALAHALAAAPDATLRLGEGDAARYVDLRVSPLTDRAGAPSGSLVLLHDVTRRRQERAALRRANASLYHANAELQARNDELDAFAHTVAHDLKNSIHVVMGNAEILRDDGPVLTAATHREIAGDVAASAQKMGTVVHELLLLAGVRQAAVELQPVAMGAVVAEALERVRETQTAAFAPTVLLGNWPVAWGHAPWVEEIWVNYLSNAAKYGGPAVTLGADAPPSGQPRFWVHDDGPGIPLASQPHLFLPFSRLGSQAVEGHGLGLSIVRRIVERLGGTCGVESAPSRGTRFWFALPSAPAAGPDQDQASGAGFGVLAAVSSAA